MIDFPNQNPPFLLSIETSCDDTSVALVNSSGFVKSQLYLNQNTRHQFFGGIVPEIASRAHTEVLLNLINQILHQNKIDLKDLAGIAVTSRPGLIGSLLVGVVTAKSLAMAWEKPVVAVNHLHGHIAANLLWDLEMGNAHISDGYPSFPWLVLAISGGHSSLYWLESLNSIKIIGKTRDDAAGEAFDKFSKLIGLGFPGGPLIDRWAKKYGLEHPNDFGVKNPYFHLINLEGFDFSFSGIKSAAERIYRSQAYWDQDQLGKLIFFYQKAIIDSILLKLRQAYDQYTPATIMVTGGVSANSYLRDELIRLEQKINNKIFVPPLRYCTDNGAMIGLAGWWQWHKKAMIDQNPSLVVASPNSLEGDFYE